MPSCVHHGDYEKGIKIDNQTIYLEKLYGQLLVISNKVDLPSDFVFGFELVPFPSSVFEKYGLMRRKTSKSTLVSKLIVYYKGSVLVDGIDGNELIDHTTWPKMRTIVALYDNLVNVTKQDHTVCLLFMTNTRRIPLSRRREENTRNSVF